MKSHPAIFIANSRSWSLEIREMGRHGHFCGQAGASLQGQECRNLSRLKTARCLAHALRWCRGMGTTTSQPGLHGNSFELLKNLEFVSHLSVAFCFTCKMILIWSCMSRLSRSNCIYNATGWGDLHEPSDGCRSRFRSVEPAEVQRGNSRLEVGESLTLVIFRLRG